MSKVREEDVAVKVMAWMIECGWDCYPEVEMPGGRADIVGVRPFPFLPSRKCVHIVECKTSWTLSLLEQAIERRAYAHYVTLAAPTRPSRFYERLCRNYGFGMIIFSKCGDIEEYGTREREGRLFRHKRGTWAATPQKVLDLLHEDMKKYTPGTTSSSGYSTPWRRTMDACAKFVRENPGCSVKDIVEKVDYHYASKSGAKQGILLWLPKREDVRVVKDGNTNRFYPVEEQKRLTV